MRSRTISCHTHPTHLLLAAALIGVSALACDEQPQRSPTEPSSDGPEPATQSGALNPKKALIAFVTDRDGDYEIYAMTADGKKQTRLTNDTGFDLSPAWSPDRTKIAFASFPNGGVDANIFVMNADGSGRTQLTTDPTFEDRPAWSPDGTKIAFERDGSLVIMNADGTHQTVLPHGDQDSDAQPHWSRDGARLVFTRTPLFSRDRDIWVMNTDGTGATALTHDNPETEAFADFSPRWSPDGTKIAFVSNRDGRQQIYLMNADGTNQTKVTNTGLNDGVSWSPDGIRLAVSHLESDNYEIQVINTDGSRATDITNNLSSDSGPAWAP
jgi:Tol biopolymer transport system component